MEERRSDRPTRSSVRACLCVSACARAGARQRVRARVWIKLESALKAVEAERGEEK